MLFAANMIEIIGFQDMRSQDLLRNVLSTLKKVSIHLAMGIQLNCVLIAFHVFRIII